MNILSMLPQGDSFWLWISLIVLSTIIIRIILCLFKTLAVKQGEADYKDEISNQSISFKNWKRWKIFRKLLRSNAGDLHIDDYFLSTFVGSAELVCFPILMDNHKWYYIGFWMLIKTAGSWGMWGKSRTVYNRFLLGNILSLFFSYALFHMFFLKEDIMKQFLSLVGISISRVGLILNLVGAVVIAWSVRKNLEKAHQVDAKGRKIYLAVIRHPVAGLIGIILLILGFLLQFFSTFG